MSAPCQNLDVNPIRRFSRLSRHFAALLAVTVAVIGGGAKPTRAQTECGTGSTKPISTFGELGLWAMNFPLIQSAGMEAHQITGKNVTWSYLVPDGVTPNQNRLRNLDVEVRTAFEQGMGNVVLRILTGGGGQDPFNGDVSTWPVDMASYGTKDGEYLGPRWNSLLEGLTAFPPKVLTRDEPGNESPFYAFVYLLASRYNGCTPDPDPLYAGKMLPRVDYFTAVHEPDSKGFWYGTSKEVFGGVGGDPAVGMMPTIWRAVKAANPRAKVVSGGLTSQNLGYYLTFEKAQQAGNLYTTAVRTWGKTYFSTSYQLQQPFNTYLGNDAGLYNHYATDPEEARSRLILDAGFSASADDWYDVVGIHFYDNPVNTLDVMAWIKARQRASKPIWFTEAGFIDQPQLGQAPLLDNDAQARGLIQKFVTLIGEGVEHVVYTPVMASPTAPGFEPLWDGTPSSPVWRPAANSLKLVADAIGEKSGFTFFMKRTTLGGLYYEFAHADGQQRLAFAWHPTSTVNLDLRSTFGIESTVPIDIYDYQGNQLWEQSTGTQYTVTTSPVLIRWNGTPTGPGCNVAGTAAGRSPLENLLILALPILRAAWRSAGRRATAAARAR